MLSSGDLALVQNTIWEARSQWYNIGLGVGISADSLDAIESDNQSRCDHCFRDMLKLWLRKNHPRPCWSVIADALRSPSVKMSHLAQQLPQQCKS